MARTVGLTAPKAKAQKPQPKGEKKAQGTPKAGSKAAKEQA